MECVKTAGHLTAFILLQLLFIIAIIICGYGTYKMYIKIRSKKDTFMLARHPTLMFSSLIMNIIDLMLIQPIHCIIFIFMDIDTMYLSLTILCDIRFILFGFFFFARIWLLHFDYHFGKQCVALLWRRKNDKKKMIINKSKSKWDNFYLNHRQTFGNDKRVIIATLILILICLIILDFVPLITGISQTDDLSLNDYIRIPIFLIEGIMLITLFRKVQSIDDRFKIRLEIMCILCIPGFFAFIYMIFEILITLKPITNQYEMNHCDFFYIYAYFMLIIVSFTAIIETILPLQLDKNQSQSVQHTLRLMKSSKTGKDVSFGDILGSSQGLLLFVEHLETEFSVENILFIVFIAKYREYYMSKIIPTLLGTHESILQSKKNNNTLANGGSDEEYSTTRETSAFFKAIRPITPKTTPRNILKFNKKRFADGDGEKSERNQGHHHDEVSPPPQTPEPPKTPKTPKTPNIIPPLTPKPNSNSNQLDKPESPQSISDPKSVSPNSYNPSEENQENKKNKEKTENIKEKTEEKEGSEENAIFHRIEKELQKNRIQRALSNASDSYLKTPVPGSFKHSPMILEDRNTDLLCDIDIEVEQEMDVFLLKDVEEEDNSNTYDDDIDENIDIDIDIDIDQQEKTEESEYETDEEEDEYESDEDEGMEYLTYNDAKSHSPPHFQHNHSNDLDVILSIDGSSIPPEPDSPYTITMDMDDEDISMKQKQDKELTFNMMDRTRQPIDGVQEEDEDDEDEDEASIIINSDIDSDKEQTSKIVTPSFHSQKKSQSFCHKKKKDNKRVHVRGWTVASVIPSPEKIAMKNNRKLVDALNLSIIEHANNNNSDHGIQSENETENETDNEQSNNKLIISKLGTPTPNKSNSRTISAISTSAVSNTNTEDLSDDSEQSIDSKQDLMRDEQDITCKDNNKCTKISITPLTTALPPKPDHYTIANSKKLHDLLNATHTTKNGQTDYSSIATVLGTSSKPKNLKMPSSNPYINGRGHSVDLTSGIVEKQQSDRQKEMNKYSMFQSIFGGNNKVNKASKHERNISTKSAKSIKSDSAGMTNRSSIISMPDRSERSSIFGSNRGQQRESIKFSSRINYDIVRNSIDFDLQCDISNIVNPLTQDFIPIPESFNNVKITKAAKHIFKQFIDDGAPYMINISHETRSNLKTLFKDNGKLRSMSALSKIFLFDASFHEIYITIASDSFLRFKSSYKFRKFLKEGHLKTVPDALHNKEDSQWSFNASFIDFNASLYEQNNDIITTRNNIQLKALPSGQTIDGIERFS